MSRETSGTAPAAGDILVRVGVILFAVGALGTLAAFIPFFLHAHRLPTAAYLVSMLMGVGFAVALGGLLWSAAAQRRRTRSSL